MEKPLDLTRKAFISGQNIATNQKKINLNSDLPQRYHFSLTKEDLEIFEGLLDRLVKLGKRSKTKTSIIRMALRALEEKSDTDFLDLNEKF
jgi:hypothetical protein